MSAKVYVGNLSWRTLDDTLRQAFSDFGRMLDSVVFDVAGSRSFREDHQDVDSIANV